MEIRKRAKIKRFPHDEFKDNDTLEKIAKELNDGGANVVLGSLDAAINWGRSNSPWSLTFGTSCCGIEFMAIGCSRYDMARFGWEVTRNSPRQADLIMCAGTITNKMAPVFKRLYDEMAEPKYVVAVGGCTISGGPFKKSYNVVRGIDELVPVDVYIPGCPPRPESLIYGMMQLQRKIKVEKFFGGANHKMTAEEREDSMSRGGLRGLSNANKAHAKIGNKAPIIVTGAPTQEEINKLGEELEHLEKGTPAAGTSTETTKVSE
jgi:NADH-quinone oxidoreductase subunit B